MGTHTHTDPFAPALQTAHTWLAALCDDLGIDDRAYGYRLTTAWLHAVRDRLDAPAIAHLSAQLPMMLRGTLFGGWKPGAARSRPAPAGFVDQFADEAGVVRAEVPELVGAITRGLDRRFSAGQLDRAFASLPTPLADLLWGGVPPAGLEVADVAVPAWPASAELDAAGTFWAELDLLAGRVDALVDAVSTLVRGLEDIPLGSPAGAARDERVAEAAQRAHRILLARTPGDGAEPGSA